MKNYFGVAKTMLTLSPKGNLLKIAAVFSTFFSFSSSGAQAVTEIITDYNGYWKSSAAAVSSIKPDKAHNLLAFTYNGTCYSTGVNDGLLTTNGQSFVRQDFWSLPVSSLNGTITSNTKVGLGALYDGVYNGASNPAPEWGIESYLTDGFKGLGLGTCIANLPVGSITFSTQNIQAASIGDGVPDVLITQVADPTGNSYDRYEFTDAAGVRIGNYKDIVFSSINPVGNWTADFYEARTNPMTLSGGFTQTDRPLRLWAADLSDFGITAANFSQIKNLKITLCGNSDIAFVGYNNKSISFQQVLPVQYNFFKASVTNNTVALDWQTQSEGGTSRFVIERSGDGILFTALDSVAAKGATTAFTDYNYIDHSPLQGKSYYRLKQIDKGGRFTDSKIVKADRAASLSLAVYPNPASDKIYAEHLSASGSETLVICNAAGTVLKQIQVQANTVQTQITVKQLPAGTYFISYLGGSEKRTAKFMIN